MKKLESKKIFKAFYLPNSAPKIAPKIQKVAKIDELSEFLMDYAVKMLSAGSYTSRVEKCVTRIGAAFGYEVHTSIFATSIDITVFKDRENYRTCVRNYKNDAINFNAISLLSALSWHVYDDNITFAHLKEHYEKIIAKTRYGFFGTLVLSCFAFAAFCRLFGGDFGSMPIIFVSTFIGISLRKFLTHLNADMRVIFVLCAFVASMIAYLGGIAGLTNTPDVAIGSSVLFLIPGIYLINSAIDMLDGHALIGFSRAISVMILIACIAVGLYITLNISNIRMAY